MHCLNSSAGSRNLIPLVQLTNFPSYHSKLFGFSLCDCTVISAYPDSVNVLEGMEHDLRTPDKLLDGVNDTMDGKHMWLAPILPNTVCNLVYGVVLYRAPYPSYITLRSLQSTNAFCIAQYVDFVFSWIESMWYLTSPLKYLWSKYGITVRLPTEEWKILQWVHVNSITQLIYFIWTPS